MTFFFVKNRNHTKDKCTQYSVTSTNVKLSSWKSDRTSMTLLPIQQKKKNLNRPNKSATRWRVLKLFDQGGTYCDFYKERTTVMYMADMSYLLMQWLSVSVGWCWTFSRYCVAMTKDVSWCLIILSAQATERTVRVPTELAYFLFPFKVQICAYECLTCLQPVALSHSFWCYLISQLLISSMNNLLEIFMTISGPVKCSITASFASLSEISLPMMPLWLGIQSKVTRFSVAMLFSASKHCRTISDVIASTRISKFL